MKRLSGLSCLCWLLVTLFSGNVSAQTHPPLGDVARLFPFNASRVLPDPSRERVYALVPETDTLAVIDVNSLQVIQTLSLGGSLSDLAISPDGNTLYVSHHAIVLAAPPTVNSARRLTTPAATAATPTVDVVNLDTLQVGQGLSLPNGVGAIAAGLNGRLYAVLYGTTSNANPSLCQLDAATGTIQATLDAASSYEVLQRTPDGKTLFASQQGHDPLPGMQASLDLLSRFDVSTVKPALLQSISAVQSIRSLRLSPDGKSVTASSEDGDASTSLFSTVDLTASRVVFPTAALSPVAFSADDALAYYMTDDIDGVLSVYNTATAALVTSLELANFSGDEDSRSLLDLHADRTGSYLFATEFSGVTSDDVPFGTLVVYTTGTGSLTPPALLPKITVTGDQTAAPGTAFTYQINATHTPASYAVTSQPSGLTVNPQTGLISGTVDPAATGTYELTLSATNAAGTVAAELDLALRSPAASPPVITGSLAASVTVNVPYAYQITATNQPTGYGASGLPSGLSVDAHSGLISGTPTVAGTFDLVLLAANAGGQGSAPLTLTITSTLPTLTLQATTPLAVVGTGIPAAFTLTCDGSPSANLLVQYTVKGTAANGADYQLLKGTKRMKAGKSSVLLRAIPLGDLDGAAKKTVKLTLTPDPAYVLTGTQAAKVKLYTSPQD